MAAEKQFEHRITRFLESKGIYALGTEQQKMTIEPVGYYNKRFGGTQYVKSGLPDYQIVIHGVCFEVEVKAPKGVVSEVQKQKIQQINLSGGIGIVLYPKDFDEFKKIIEKVVNMDCPKNILDSVILQ